MNPKISIVVPVYQVEKYIQNTIRSIINQSFKDFEVVLVNDGTRDKSIEEAEKLLSKTNINYLIINQQNKGVSAARNEGIRQSNGEWVICIDSDDIISNNLLEILYESSIEHNTDLSIGNYQSITEATIFKASNKLNSRIILEQRNILELFLTRAIKIISPAMLLNKQFILDNNLFYNEEIRFSEDQLFIWRVLLKTEKCSYNTAIIYNYLVRSNSTMTASGIDKIMTGYFGFQNFSDNLNYKEYEKITKFIFPRWILGALRASSKMLNYNDFKTLAFRMNYKEHTKSLFDFPNKSTRIMHMIMMFNLRLFYFVNKIV
ncbi:glycosyltransferase family 2 protein [Proteiniclasticum ruminis]|uniref:Glycosyltransferase involved in cell wall bisynthesis n=1 Tax=Proteiniclasticum ruminis TaxID=398199 RepID=A0A1I5A7A5_9CLOT|nr:glycosyltransferase family 2 protein [Proteiniclasticum ruminis]SFN58278.1 Glycosyltransferase involved in cell wall bisynthesis [Proteiniclasticum ruminis]